MANFLLEIDYFALQPQSHEDKRVASKPPREKIKGSIKGIHLFDLLQILLRVVLAQDSMSEKSGVPSHVLNTG